MTRGEMNDVCLFRPINGTFSLTDDLCLLTSKTASIIHTDMSHLASLEPVTRSRSLKNDSIPALTLQEFLKSHTKICTFLPFGLPLLPHSHFSD